MFDIESAVGFDIENKNKSNINNSELLSTLFSTEDESKNLKKFKQKANKTDLQKRTNLLDKIFNYIYYAPYQYLFSLAWYDDIIYKVDNIIDLSKAFPEPCCNKSSYQSAKPKLF